MTIEVDVRAALPQFHIVGLPDAAIGESRQRVWSAIKNSGFELPQRAVLVNLAPADLRKEGNHLDLAIALGLLAAYEHLPQQVLENRLICGELGLDGSVRPVRGALALAALAGQMGSHELLLPLENAAEDAALENPPVRGVPHLADAVQHLVGAHLLPEAKASFLDPDRAGKVPDFRDVRGQATAKRALEIAAAGGHNLLLLGPPGCGKTMLASRLPGVLPPLSREEAITITKIHSVANHRPSSGLLSTRPFRSPHAVPVRPA